MAQTRKLVEEELIRTATQAFCEQGYQNTTLDEIVSKVGISRVTFYTYFESKGHLLSVIFERTISSYLRGLRNIAEQPLPRIEMLRRGVLYIVSSLVQDQAIIQLLFREEANLPREAATLVTKMQREIERMIKEDMAKGIQQGELIDEDPLLLMYACTGMWNWMYRWYQPGQKYTPEDVARVFTRILESGILAPEAPVSNVSLSSSLQQTQLSLKEVQKELTKISRQLTPKTKQIRPKRKRRANTKTLSSRNPHV